MKPISIKDLTNRLKEDFGLSQAKISKLLGVTPLMIHNYQKEKVKLPNQVVAFKIWDNITLDGEKVVLDIFDSEDQLLQAYSYHKKTRD